MAAFAFASGEPLLLLWATAVAAIAVTAVVWARTAWRDVAAEASFEPSRAFVGEDTFLVVRVANAKRLPLPIVDLLVSFPEGLYAEEHPDPTAMRGHRRRMSVDGRTETTLRIPIRAPHRGEYWLEEVQVTLSDPFDLVPLRRAVEVERPLVVMPEPRVGIPLRIRRRLPFGSPAPAARLFEDREHFAGVRDYQLGDPLHHVHWRLSAHTGRLQTKRFEPTRSAEVLFAVDVSNGEPFWHAVSPEAAEEAIGWASYLARQALHAGWRTGLVANTHLRKGRGPLRVPASGSRGHEALLFAALARMPNQPTSDLGPVLREIGRRLPVRTTVVVISARPGPSLLREIGVLRRRGCEVLQLSPPEAALGEETA